MTREQRRNLYAQAAIVGLALSGMIFVFQTEAIPHEAPTGWSYPPSCCSNQDCREVATVDVLEGPDGYRIRQNGETVAYGDTRLKDSPDGAFHLCTVAGTDEGRTLCLFVPPRGF